VHTLSHLRRRHGFALTDSGTDLVGALDSDPILHLVPRASRDSFSHGLKEKAPADGSAAQFKQRFSACLWRASAGRAHSEFQNS